jgi:hypothetical protein
MALSRYKLHIIAAVTLVFVAIVGVIFLLKMSSTGSDDQMQFVNITPPDMTSTIELVFDIENPNAFYDWAIVDTELGETFIETNSFSQYGNDYELLLATRKANPEDETYTVPDYMTLTLRVPNADGGVDVISYIDIGADGITDSAYLNDVEIAAEEALFVAQDQYAEELYTARNYMLDGVSI